MFWIYIVALWAIVSSVLVEIRGICRAKLSIFAVAAAILSPVKLPGPFVKQNAPISSNLQPASCRTASIEPNNSLLWRIFPEKIFSASKETPRPAATEPIRPEQSTARK